MDVLEKSAITVHDNLGGMEMGQSFCCYWNTFFQKKNTNHWVGHVERAMMILHYDWRRYEEDI